jgi:hypothetical protein
MYNSFTAGFGGVGDVEGHEEAQRARDCVRARPGHGDLMYAYGLYQCHGDLNPASTCVREIVERLDAVCRVRLILHRPGA